MTRIERMEGVLQRLKCGEEILKEQPELGIRYVEIRKAEIVLVAELIKKALLLEKSGLVEAALFCLENSHRNGPAVLSKALTAYEEGK